MVNNMIILAGLSLVATWIWMFSDRAAMEKYGKAIGLATTVFAFAGVISM